MVYRTIIDVILHFFIICNDLWCQLPFFSQTFRHNGSAVFGTMPAMCRSCPDVNKLRGMDTSILGQHRPFMSIKSFVQHSGWQEMVSLCSLIRLIGVCADRDQPEFLCSRSDSRYLEVHVATSGGWLTRYRPRNVRNSIYRYRKIHIDYRSKILYRFISTISIIYGNTNDDISVSLITKVALRADYTYRQTSNIRQTLLGNKIIDHSDVAGAAPSNYIFIFGLTPVFSTLHKDNCKTRWETFKFVIWCHLY